MFTGIIEDRGKVLSVENRGQGRRLSLEVPIDLTDVQVGDSININGVCLTIMEKKRQTLTVDLSTETLQKTVLGELQEGDQVNLERALRVGDRLGGHIVTGHIDGIGVITEKREQGDFLRLSIRVPGAVAKYVVKKGSIAIDGISLTANECRGEEVEITLIPYTIKKTTLVNKKIGDRVNVEADILGKYVERMISRGEERPKGLDLSFLKEHGFIGGE